MGPPASGNKGRVMEVVLQGPFVAFAVAVAAAADQNMSAAYGKNLHGETGWIFDETAVSRRRIPRGWGREAVVEMVTCLMVEGNV